MNRCNRYILSLGFFLSFFSAIQACSIPVFRYALEKWNPDPYVAIICYDKELTEDQQATLTWLTDFSSQENNFINLLVYSYSAEALQKSSVIEWFKEAPASLKSPRLYLFAPTSFGQARMLWQCNFEKKYLKTMLTSDTRNKINTNLGLGTSCCWLMLESGNVLKDDAAAKICKDTITKLEKEANLPDGVIHVDGSMTGDPEDTYANPENQLISAIPLKIEYKFIRFKAQDDPVLAAALLDKTDITGNSGEPMIFSTFGRGRALEPMIGEEINEDNLYYISSYLSGACSCQVKEQNPGYDLPMLKNWEALIYGEHEGLDFTNVEISLQTATP